MSIEFVGREGAGGRHFSILKRGINGVYHHVSQQHLRRYLGKFGFRYGTGIVLNVGDDMRATKLLQASQASASPIGKPITGRMSKPVLIQGIQGRNSRYPSQL